MILTSLFLSLALLPPSPELQDRSEETGLQFLSKYPREVVTPLIREAFTTFLEAEDLYKDGSYKAASDLLNGLWQRHPQGSAVWEQAYSDSVRLSNETGVNLGAPSAYYALRMLTDCVEWRLAGGRVEDDAAKAVFSVVVFGISQGNQPKSIEDYNNTGGALKDQPLKSELLAPGYPIIRQSTWLFLEYVSAATDGQLAVSLKVVSLPETIAPVQTTWSGNSGFSSIANDKWDYIWEVIPKKTRETSDWWWIIYPSMVPSGYPNFRKAEFVTGGMGTGPDGVSPCFIIDDAWLTRKPPHLGQGIYSDFERRVYLPQWMQHEFFHHLYRIYPEHKLEVKGHDWFDRSSWPQDFNGFIEPDYYQESLHKRIKGSDPTLASRLTYAPPSSATWKKLLPKDVIGEYVREPEENHYHRGRVVRDQKNKGKFKWVLKGNTGWQLDPKLAEGVLKTGPDCPYYPEQPEFKLILKKNSNGQFTNEVEGFRFGGDLFRKQR